MLDIVSVVLNVPVRAARSCNFVLPIRKNHDSNFCNNKNSILSVGGWVSSEHVCPQIVFDPEYVYDICNIIWQEYACDLMYQEKQIIINVKRKNPIFVVFNGT